MMKVYISGGKDTPSRRSNTLDLFWFARVDFFVS